MGQGGVTETELMPNFGGGYTELGGGKLKKGNGFLEPNLEPVTNRAQRFILAHAADWMFPA